mmetsp:Transcript_17380/g.17467  ORF Transcript_17380/g.17467 Transcript_17380/m.17467 type:complete len:94 (+) Transcript_17380:210-491(+)|eukprot:CAMPEP_0182428784 /NCGR_PEP_ID=MMETSP1167-20130531/23605_1 /TAXON_ID=2988 /ORGANISM="Mallomonas Sp, Strain CCMP3275" /LENGTH=93 /DNA_ID=CAMNT_0024611881 /DNA_START=177 /DNA_END=458 /DNA_ORIENTATION=-
MSSSSTAPQEMKLNTDEGFVNEGMERWEHLRKEWLKKRGTRPKSEVRAKNIDVGEVVERIFSNSSGGILPEPIPLGQMIDILIDFWEADGLYD